MYLSLCPQLVGNARTYTYVQEQSVIDPKEQTFELQSSNVSTKKFLKNYKYCINTSCFLAHSGWKTRLPSTDQSTLLQSYLVVLPAEYRPWCWQAGANLISFLTAKNGRIFPFLSYMFLWDLFDMHTPEEFLWLNPRIKSNLLNCVRSHFLAECILTLEAHVEYFWN